MQSPDHCPTFAIPFELEMRLFRFTVQFPHVSTTLSHCKPNTDRVGSNPVGDTAFRADALIAASRFSSIVSVIAARALARVVVAISSPTGAGHDAPFLRSNGFRFPQGHHAVRRFLRSLPTHRRCETRVAD
jgi:hypothetical protein